MFQRFTQSRGGGAGWRFAIAMLLMVVPLASAASSASAEGPTLSNMSVGIRGNFHVGRWTAIEADVESDSWPVTLVVRVPDPDGNLTLQPSIAVPQPDEMPVRVRSLFKTGRLTDSDDTQKEIGFPEFLHVEVQTPDGSRTFQLTSADPTADDQIQVPSLKHAWTQKTRFWATLGESEGYQLAADRIIDRGQGLRLGLYVIPLKDASDLPTQPGALDSLDTLMVTGPHAVGPETNEAIRRWVAAGGHLILSVATPDDYAALPTSEWIPIRVTGKSQLRDLTNLTTQLPGSTPIRVDVVHALQFEFDQGETVAATLDGPLWARVPYGFGLVTVLGVDLSRRPLAGWDSLPQLCEKLTGFRRVSERRAQRSATAQLSQTGVSELQTQLVQGLDQFPGVQKPTSWFAMGMILLYLLAIGPLDYLIVHKLLKRPHWTWVTFPLMVLIAAGAAAATATDRNTQSMLANQVDLVDVDLASSTARFQSWMSFTSPQQGRYQIDGRLTQEVVGTEDDSAVQPLVSWAGLPETGFRGMYRSGGIDQWKATYEFAPGEDAILDLPVGIWSSANTVAAWPFQPASVDRLVRADLKSSMGQLTGTLTNNLSVPMQDWCVAHEGRVYLPMTRSTGAAALKIAPGETLDFSDGGRVVPFVLQSFLTGVRRIQIDTGKTTGKETVASRDVYDPLERNPFTVLRMATFFEAARGDEFTSLDNHTLDQLDLSALLHLDRAVLFCRVASSAVEFAVNEQPQQTSEHETVLRIVLPVQPQ